MKKVWMTMLSKNEEAASKLMSQLKTMGLDINGHFWIDEPSKMSWTGPRDELLDKDLAVWMIVATSEDIANSSIIYGLSLLTTSVQAKKGHGFPVVIIMSDGSSLSSDNLPTPLKNATIISGLSAAFGAKIVALANKPVKDIPTGYHIDVYGIPGLGQWFEVGPQGTGWKGAIFGSSEGEILAHGVGEKGKLPTEKMILNYPSKGIKLKLGDKDYVAWALQNELDEGSSYYVKLDGHPESVLFGPYGQEDDAEVYVVKLK